MGKITHKLFKSHKPIGGETTFNGKYYISICKYCYEPIKYTGSIFSLTDTWVIDEYRQPVKRVYEDPDK